MKLKSLLINITLLCSYLVSTNGLYIGKNARSTESSAQTVSHRNRQFENDKDFRSLNNFQRKLYSLGLYPEENYRKYNNMRKGYESTYKEKEFPFQTMYFDELETLRLIPIIIDQLRLGHITRLEQNSLAEIFGDLWQVMVDEANRRPGTEMNFILKTLLRTRELKRRPPIRNKNIKRYISEQQNPGKKMETLPKQLLFRKSEYDKISQKLLNMATILIYRALNENKEKHSDGIVVVKDDDDPTKNDGSLLQQRTKRNIIKGSKSYSGTTSSYVQQQHNRDKNYMYYNDDVNEKSINDDYYYADEDMYDDFIYDDNRDSYNDILSTPTDYGRNTFQKFFLLAAKYRMRRENDEIRQRNEESRFMTAKTIN